MLLRSLKLRSVVGGHIRYYGVPMNGPALLLFRFQVGRLWHRTLSRRSQNGRVRWNRMRRLIDYWSSSGVWFCWFTNSR